MIPLVLKNGQIDEPSSHDGLLLGLTLSPHFNDRDSLPNLTLRWSDYANSTFELTLFQITAARFTDFMDGNIIFDLTISNGEDLAEEDLAFICGYGRQPAQEELPKYRARFSGSTALIVTSSYGCMGIAIAKTLPSEWICSQL